MSIYEAPFHFDPAHPVQLCSCRLTCGDNDLTSFHWHNCFEITQICSGRAIYAIGERSFTVQPGDLLVFHPGEYHGWQVVEQAVTTRALLFPAALVDQCTTALPCGHLAALARGSSILQNHIPAAEMMGTGLPEVLALLAQEEAASLPGAPLVFETGVLQLLTLLCRRFTADATCNFTARTAAAQRIEPAMRYLYANYARRITLKEAASLCFLSESRFSLLFQTACGCSFLHYLNGVRIQQARRLLLLTDQDVLTAALNCGFRNQANFYRLYRKYTGTAPGQERRVGTLPESK